MAEHNDLGKLGEDKALELLLAKGHRLLVRNYRVGRDEVDLITRCGDDLVFVEVKTRTNLSHGLPEEFVDKKKRQAMKRVAEEYVLRQRGAVSIRFDVVAVTNTKTGLHLLHIEDAFFNEDSEDYC